MSYCYTGRIDMTGTEPCVFKDAMVSVSGLQELQKSIPVIEYREGLKGQEFKDYCDTQHFSEEITDAKGAPRVCKGFHPESGICMMSKLNVYESCQRVKMLARQSNVK